MTSTSIDAPEGFVAYSAPSEFLDRIGPLFERVEDERVVIGLRVLPHHCNRRGLLHGACLSAICDIALGKTIERFSSPPASGLTINLSVDYLSTAKVGDWLEARVDYWRAGRTIASGNAYVRNGSTVVARANAIFAVVQRE